jgi:fatty-acid desaturase
METEPIKRSTLLNDSFHEQNHEAFHMTDPQKKEIFTEVHVEPESAEEFKQTSFCAKTKLFSSYALQDVKRNKCHFCLAFCSVWLVVWAVFVVNSVTAMGPLAFLSLA